VKPTTEVATPTPRVLTTLAASRAPVTVVSSEMATHASVGVSQIFLFHRFPSLLDSV
jgi:hypothetical protein